MDPKIVCIIPARGGSKGIPRKNIRLLNGKPLISYAIRSAQSTQLIDRIVITTDDEEIADVAKKYGTDIVRRPKELASDDVPLDPVIYHAVQEVSINKDEKYDIVITIQPTSPLISSETICKMIMEFKAKNIDTMISVKEEKHLFWIKDATGFAPFYKERKNRQYLEPVFSETGAVVICSRKSLSKNSRLGDKIFLYVIPEWESVDIDDYNDWYLADQIIRQLKIAFIVIGSKESGMGHIYRALTLADRFLGHSIRFCTLNCDSSMIELIKNRGYVSSNFNLDELYNHLGDWKPNIIINDILDTDIEFMDKLHEINSFIVNFEDLGDGAAKAHLVFNALYEKTNCKDNFRYSYEYEFLNDKFLLYDIINFNELPKTLVVTFGGVDCGNFTCQVLKEARNIFSNTPIKKIICIIGPGFAHEDELQDIGNSLKDLNIEICESVKNMPALISLADIAITSNGRTIYELTAMGIPTISIAQNDRETLHLFARYHKGIKYLGMGKNIREGVIVNALIEIATNNEIRKKMYLKQIDASKTIRKGIERVFREIQSNYEDWCYENN